MGESFSCGECIRKTICEEHQIENGSHTCWILRNIDKDNCPFCSPEITVPECIAISKEKIVCQECEEEVYTCEICDDYIEEGQEIVCEDGCNHAHKTCFDAEEDKDTTIMNNESESKVTWIDSRCQNCGRVVMILENQPYFGIICEKCMKGKVYTHKR